MRGKDPRAFGVLTGPVRGAILVAMTAAVLAAHGCASFDAVATPPDADADADTDGGGADGPVPVEASTDGSAPDAEVACIPRDVNEDAGAPDASCGGPGLADLQSSEGNCGVCGHSCLDGGCANGQCNVQDLIPLGFVSNNPPGIGALHDGVLYLAHAGVISRVSVDDAGAPTELLDASALLGANLSPPFLARGLGWTVADQSELVSFPLDGGGPTVETGSGNVGAIATDGNAVYYADANSRVVRMVGSVTALYTGDASIASIDAMAVDGDGLFLMVGLASVTARSRLLLRSPSGDISMLISDVPQATRMLLDGGYLYWADVAGAVWRLAKGTTVPQQVMQVPLMPFPYVKGLVVDAQNVYIVTTEDGNGGSVNALFYVGSKCGGPARLLRSGDSFWGGALLADDHHLFWTHSDGIERMAK